MTKTITADDGTVFELFNPNVGGGPNVVANYYMLRPLQVDEEETKRCAIQLWVPDDDSYTSNKNILWNKGGDLTIDATTEGATALADAIKALVTYTTMQDSDSDVPESYLMHDFEDCVRAARQSLQGHRKGE